MDDTHIDTGFVNKVAQSGLITIDLKDFLPRQPITSFDLKGYLFMEMVLKEKDYREALKTTDWTTYAGTLTAIHCSADAIIPMWAYMLAGVYLTQAGATVSYGTPADVKKHYLIQAIHNIDTKTYAGERIIIKGCADDDVQAEAYIAITEKLTPVVKSLMYGEACSNVPLYKQKTKASE